jgi:hypothetical protein
VSETAPIIREVPAEACDFCTVPRKVRFQQEPRILVRIERTTRRHALVRAVVELEDNFVRVLLGDFIIFKQGGKVVVAGPRLIRCSYRLGKRVEQEVLAAFQGGAR